MNIEDIFIIKQQASPFSATRQKAKGDKTSYTINVLQKPRKKCHSRMTKTEADSTYILVYIKGSARINHQRVIFVCVSNKLYGCLSNQAECWIVVHRTAKAKPQSPQQLANHSTYQRQPPFAPFLPSTSCNLLSFSLIFGHFWHSAPTIHGEVPLAVLFQLLMT